MRAVRRRLNSLLVRTLQICGHRVRRAMRRGQHHSTRSIHPGERIAHRNHRGKVIGAAGDTAYQRLFMR